MSRQLAIAALGGALGICVTCAAQAQSVAAKGSWTGYAGLGMVAYSKYVGGKDIDTLPAPLLSFEYKETFYVDLLRAGVRFWSTEDKKFAVGVAAEPRFGFRSGDGPRLAGMKERHTSAEAGPSVEWDTSVASLNVAYFSDVSGVSKGASLRGSVYKQLLDTPRWDAGPYAGVERVNHRVSSYYFGVPAAEAVAGRPAYQPGGATNWMLGFSGAYKFNPSYALMFGVQNTRLGGSAAASPIVDTRNARLGYVGLGWVL